MNLDTKVSIDDKSVLNELDRNTRYEFRCNKLARKWLNDGVLPTGPAPPPQRRSEATARHQPHYPAPLLRKPSVLPPPHPALDDATAEWKDARDLCIVYALSHTTAHSMPSPSAAAAAAGAPSGQWAPLPAVWSLPIAKQPFLSVGSLCYVKDAIGARWIPAKITAEFGKEPDAQALQAHAAAAAAASLHQSGECLLFLVNNASRCLSSLTCITGFASSRSPGSSPYASPQSSSPAASTPSALDLGVSAQAVSDVLSGSIDRQIRIHYLGQSASFDEWLTPSIHFKRLQPIIDPRLLMADSSYGLSNPGTQSPTINSGSAAASHSSHMHMHGLASPAKRRFTLTFGGTLNGSGGGGGSGGSSGGGAGVARPAARRSGNSSSIDCFCCICCPVSENIRFFAPCWPPHKPTLLFFHSQ
jgi:hypothetical protein